MITMCHCRMIILFSCVVPFSANLEQPHSMRRRMSSVRLYRMRPVNMSFNSVNSYFWLCDFSARASSLDGNNAKSPTARYGFRCRYSFLISDAM